MVETFGYLTRIVAITVKPSKPFAPWYSYFPKQQPMALSRLDATTNGHWSRRPFFSEIAGGPFGPAANIPIPKIGFNSLEDAIDQGQPLNDYSPIQFMHKPAQNTSGDTPLHTPNIWQITGLKQPHDKHGQIAKPSGTLAEQVANTYKKDWNSTSDDYNAQWAAIEGVTDGYQISYPSSSFAVSIGNPSSPNTRFAFTGGIPAAFWLFGGRSIIVAPVYATALNVGQLNPKVWDTDTFPPFRR